MTRTWRFMRTLGRSRENVDFTLISCPEFLCLFVPSLTSGNVGPGQESTQPKIRASHLDVGVVEASDGCGGPDAVSGRAANDESLPGLQNIHIADLVPGIRLGTSIMEFLANRPLQITGKTIAMCSDAV